MAVLSRVLWRAFALNAARGTATGTSVCAASPVIAAPWKGGAFCRPSSVGLQGIGGVNDPPPARAFLTPGAPRGVVHATDAPCQCSQNLDANAPMFRVPSARTLRRPRAAEVALNPRGDHSASLVGKESSCQ